MNEVQLVFLALRVTEVMPVPKVLMVPGKDGVRGLTGPLVLALLVPLVTRVKLVLAALLVPLELVVPRRPW